tara:strand:- start:1527 stop:2453 length:927 start_codon:yes stop_codon:yes gene_type:complete
LSTRDGEKTLVVDGMFTTKLKQHQVKLSYTTVYPSNPNALPEEQLISGAQVQVISEAGETFDFYESAIGVYSTIDSVAGIVGGTYQLRLFVDDQEYLSDPQTITPVTAPDSIYYEYLEDEDNIAVYIDSKDPGDSRNFYRWTWTSNYIVITNFGDELDCCARCFISKVSNDIVLHEDTYTNGQPIIKKEIAKIPVDINGDYLIFINQHSISIETYDYYDLLNRQISSTGNLFDPPPSRLIGNISAVNSNENVLGFFMASDEKTIFGQIKRSPYFTGLGKVSRYGDCRLLTNSDTLTPPFWNTKVLPIY